MQLQSISGILTNLENPENRQLFPIWKQFGKKEGTSLQNITIHIKNLFESGELEESAACKELLQVPQEGPRYSFLELCFPTLPNPARKSIEASNCRKRQLPEKSEQFKKKEIAK